MTETWAEQTLDVSSVSMPNIEYGRRSAAEPNHSGQDLNASRMSAGFADVSQLAEEEKEKLEALIERLEEERRRMMETTELLTLSHAGDHGPTARDKKEKEKLQEELEDIKNYNNDLERELDDLRASLHANLPPRTSTPQMHPIHYSPVTQNLENYPTHTQKRESYPILHQDYGSHTHTPRMDPDINHIIEKYRPGKCGVQVLPSRPSPHHFETSPLSQGRAASPYRHVTYDDPTPYDTRWVSTHVGPQYEKLKDRSSPHSHMSSPYNAQRGTDAHPSILRSSPTNLQRSQGERSHRSMSNSPRYSPSNLNNGHPENIPERSHRSLRNSPRMLHEGLPTSVIKSVETPVKRSKGDDLEYPTDRITYGSRESLRHTSKKPHKSSYTSSIDELSSLNTSAASTPRNSHKRRGRSPTESPQSNSPKRSPHRSPKEKSRDTTRRQQQETHNKTLHTDSFTQSLDNGSGKKSPERLHKPRSTSHMENSMSHKKLDHSYDSKKSQSSHEQSSDSSSSDKHQSRSHRNSRPSHGSLGKARHVVSCENLGGTQSSHGSLDSVDTLHGDVSQPSFGSQGVYGTSNTETISPIPDSPRSFDPRREYTEEIDPYSQIHSSDHDLTEKSYTNIDKAFESVGKKSPKSRGNPLHGAYLAPGDVHVRMIPKIEAPQHSIVKSDHSHGSPMSHKSIPSRTQQNRNDSSKSQSSIASQADKPTPKRRSKRKEVKDKTSAGDLSGDASRSQPEGNLKSELSERSSSAEESFETPEEEMKFLVSKLQGMMPKLLDQETEDFQTTGVKAVKPMNEVFVAAEQTRKAIKLFAEYAIAVVSGEI